MSVTSLYDELKKANSVQLIPDDHPLIDSVLITPLLYGTSTNSVSKQSRPQLMVNATMKKNMNSTDTPNGVCTTLLGAPEGSGTQHRYNNTLYGTGERMCAAVHTMTREKFEELLNRMIPILGNKGTILIDEAGVNGTRAVGTFGGYLSQLHSKVKESFTITELKEEATKPLSIGIIIGVLVLIILLVYYYFGRA